MVVVEYGKQNSQVVMLLHGGGLSWWNYREVAETLESKYHVILPILDGHSGSDKDFSSIENNAEEMIAYIDEVHNGSVCLMGGVSLGAQILIEMLTQRTTICQYAIIESALVIPMKWTYFLIKPMMHISYGLIKQAWFSKLQFQALRIKKDWYEDYYRDTCNITKENMIAFLESNACYTIKNELEKSCAKSFIFVGKKEPSNMIRSAYCLSKILPNSSLKIMDKRYHGEFSMCHPLEYANIVMDILKNSGNPLT